jgi:YHS domain-containing protein
MCPIDPVCGSRVGTEGRPTVECAGRLYVFCSEECRAKFVADPGSRFCHEVPEEVLRETDPLTDRWFG